MSKALLTTALSAAALGLVACGGYDKEEYNEANADYNAEETYADNAADYNMGDINDMNATSDMNAVDNAADTTADNAATNETNSY